MKGWQIKGKGYRKRGGRMKGKECRERDMKTGEEEAVVKKEYVKGKEGKEWRV